MRPRVSVITTVFNEASNIDRFIDSLFSQSSLPDEIVVVDGGSSDGTIERLRAWKGRPGGERLRVIVDPSCSRTATPGPIGRGRNIAIRAATHDVIACADAGCRLELTWLEAILRPFEDPSVSVAGGWYRPGGSALTQRALSEFWIALPAELSEHSFIPSSRSVAFRRSAWEAVGGYPETSLSSEDTMFIMNLRAAGHRIVLVRDAIVEWVLPSTVSKFARLVYRYGFGDGFNNILGRNAVITAAGAVMGVAFVVASVWQSAGWLAAWPLVAGGIAVRRRWSRRQSWRGLHLLPFVGVLRIVSDLSYLTGYLRGRSTQRHPVIEQIV